MHSALVETMIRHSLCVLHRPVFQRNATPAEGSLYLETVKSLCSAHSCKLNCDVVNSVCVTLPVFLKLHCNSSAQKQVRWGFQQQVVVHWKSKNLIYSLPLGYTRFLVCVCTHVQERLAVSTV